MTNTLLLRSGRLEDEKASPLLEPILAQKTSQQIKAGSTDESDMDFFGGHVVENCSQASGKSRPSNRSQRT